MGFIMKNAGSPRQAIVAAAKPQPRKPAAPAKTAPAPASAAKSKAKTAGAKPKPAVKPAAPKKAAPKPKAEVKAKQATVKIAPKPAATKSTQRPAKPAVVAKPAPPAQPQPRPRPTKQADPVKRPAAPQKGSPTDMTVSAQAVLKDKPLKDTGKDTGEPRPVETPRAAKEAAPAQAVPPTVAERDAMPPPGPRPVLPQRAIAKAEIFKAGDHVIYPTHGVGKVERIATEEIAGQKLDLIHITFDENRMTLRVPVNKARTAGLRKLSGRKQFDEVLAALKGRARIKRTMWSRRAQEYEAKINSGDPMAIAEVVRDLHRNAGQPDQSFSERQIFEAALERLAAEYGALEGLDKQAAIDKLLVFLKAE